MSVLHCYIVYSIQHTIYTFQSILRKDEESETLRGWKGPWLGPRAGSSQILGIFKISTISLENPCQCLPSSQLSSDYIPSLVLFPWLHYSGICTHWWGLLWAPSSPGWAVPGLPASAFMINAPCPPPSSLLFTPVHLCLWYWWHQHWTQLSRWVSPRLSKG